MPTNNDIYPEPPELKPWQAKLANFLGRLIGRAILTFVDLMDWALKPYLSPWVKDLRDDPETPPGLKPALDRYLKNDTPALAMFGASLGAGAASGVASAAMSPWLELIKRNKATHYPFMNFDYPVGLSALLRGVIDDERFKDELKHLGWRDDKIEWIKQLVWLRLDPAIVQQIWLRDKASYEHLWKDLHDIGWDDERIEVYKTLAQLIPGAADLIRMAVREVFTPEIVKKYGQMEDFPSDFAAWGAKVGLSEEWAKNYWAAHWDLPSATQGFEMLHRGVITYDDLKVLLRALDVMPYWRDKLIEIAYSPYTRVDVRRMYKVGVLDEAGVKRAYLDLGYNEERAQALTDFTLKTYARDEDAVEDEEEKIRELTRTDICDGYRRGIFTAAETRDLLAQLAYTPESIQFYLDREDLKKAEALKDAYATNYRQLFVIGLKDADTVKSEMVDLGFLPGEVDEYLRLWYIEKLRRQAKPSRTDLARFLKKEIISQDTWHQSMADLGYADKYIDWYLADMKE